MEIWQYVLFIATVLVGALLAMRVELSNRTMLKAMLSFSGAYLLSISFLHLLPSVYAVAGERVGFFILGGFLLQLILELISKGVEHGHIHAHRHARPGFIWQVLLGLSIHSLLEGMPLQGAADLHAGHGHSEFSLFYGVIAHKVPEAFALVLLLRASDVKKPLIYLFAGILALMTPLGSLLAEWIQPDPVTAACILAVVIGNFLHITTTIMFEMDTTHDHRINWYKMGAIGLGFAASLLTLH